MEESEARQLILEERQRQINVEGWTPDHDDEHDDGSLAYVAACYMLNATNQNTLNDRGVPLGWPWDDKWWKPKDPVRDLVRAGALYMAERDRLVRMRGNKHARVDRMTQRVDHIVRLLKAHSVG